MGLQTFYGIRTHRLLWAGSRAASGKITVIGISDRLNYSVIFVLRTRFTNVATGRGLNNHDLNFRVIAYSVND